MKTRRGLTLGMVTILLSVSCLVGGAPTSTLDSAIQAVERGNYPEALAQFASLPQHRSPSRAESSRDTYTVIRPYD